MFALRSKCVELAQQILDENVIGSALTQTQDSHYEPRTNRCYVKLTVHMADLERFEEYNHTLLYDGQTRELLASISNDHGKHTALSSEGDIADPYSCRH